MTKRAFSGNPHSRSVASVSDVIKSALGKFRIDKKVEQYAAFPHWEEIVGPEVAAVTIPEKIIRGKVLAVRVLDAAWAQELSMQKKEILDKLNDFGFGAVVEDIHFLTGDPQCSKKG
jgi:predicted nucleic acid-binding Zn ribbon protein